MNVHLWDVNGPLGYRVESGGPGSVHCPRGTEPCKPEVLLAVLQVLRKDLVKSLLKWRWKLATGGWSFRTHCLLLTVFEGPYLDCLKLGPDHVPFVLRLLRTRPAGRTVQGLWMRTAPDHMGRGTALADPQQSSHIPFVNGQLRWLSGVVYHYEYDHYIMSYIYIYHMYNISVWLWLCSYNRLSS